MQNSSERMDKLRAMLQREPEDTFLLYGVAMEYRKLNQPAEALAHLAKVLRNDPGYCVAYHQAGIIHEGTGDIEAAKKSYRDGIAAAEKKGDLHAKGEMEAALSMIE